jgi:fumarylacetoacetate (FAA) hydrolase
MQLATLKKGGHDGTLVLVNRALTHYRAVPAIARTLQAALDELDSCEPQLRQIYEALNSGAFANPDGCEALRRHCAAGTALPGMRL